VPGGSAILCAVYNEQRKSCLAFSVHLLLCMCACVPVCLCACVHTSLSCAAIGHSALSLAFPLEVLSVHPAVGGLKGGDQLLISGTGFPSHSPARGGGRVAVHLSFHVPSPAFPDAGSVPLALGRSVECAVTSVSSTTVRCTLQPFPHVALASQASSTAGAAAWENASSWDHDVTVSVLPAPGEGGGSQGVPPSVEAQVTLLSAYRTLRSVTPAVVEVHPQQGPAAGGSTVSLLVTRLSPSTDGAASNISVSIGGVPCTGVAVWGVYPSGASLPAPASALVTCTSGAGRPGRFPLRLTHEGKGEAVPYCPNPGVGCGKQLWFTYTLRLTAVQRGQRVLASLAGGNPAVVRAEGLSGRNDSQVDVFVSLVQPEMQRVQLQPGLCPLPGCEAVCALACVVSIGVVVLACVRVDSPVTQLITTCGTTDG
jgi:hypothetical protein